VDNVYRNVTPSSERKRPKSNFLLAIYNTMVALGTGSVAGQAPEEEPVATLYYGDQAVMQLWDMSTDKTSRVYVSFDCPDLDFSYIIGEKGMDYLMKPLSPDQNPAWE